MEILAIIPARGGSQGIPCKNIKPVAGKPLLAYTIEHALASKQVTRIIVSTDSDDIQQVAGEYGADVVPRPAELSGNEASSESALIHAIDYLAEHEGYQPDLIVFLQATSPIRGPGDIDNAISKLREDNADSLLSVTETHRFLWRQQDQQAQPVNYDFANRPRRQDKPQEYQENGSIYVFKPWVLRELGNRLGGKVTLYEMDYWSSFEIDTLEDLALVEWIMIHHRKRPLLPIKPAMVVFDFDGVFTDNRAITFGDGTEAVVVNRSDGYGISLMHKAGISMVVLSSEKNPVLLARTGKLNLPTYHGIDDKLSQLKTLLYEHGIDPSDVLYVGNDLNDRECMTYVGCSVAPADAHDEIKAVATLVLSSKGGNGAVRELCDLILSEE